MYYLHMLRRHINIWKIQNKPFNWILFKRFPRVANPTACLLVKYIFLPTWSDLKCSVCFKMARQSLYVRMYISTYMCICVGVRIYMLVSLVYCSYCILCGNILMCGLVGKKRSIVIVLGFAHFNVACASKMGA